VIPQPENRPLGILGGTFDPVHLGHLRAAWEAAGFLDAEVRLVPASVPPHRPQPVASAQQRLAMLQVSLLGQDRLRIDDRELRRQGPSYTVDTLSELREEIGAHRPLVLLLGIDAFAGLPGWHRWKSLFELAHIGILSRPGHSTLLPMGLREELRERRAGRVADVSAAPAGRVIEIVVSALEISATRIRGELAAGREPRYLVADALLADPALLESYRRT